MIGLMPASVPIQSVGANAIAQITGTSQLQVGDVAFAIQSREGASVLPTLPSGWTSLSTGTATETNGDATARVSMRISAKVITAGDIGASIANLNRLYRVRNNRTPVLPLTASFGSSSVSTFGMRRPVSAVAARVGSSSPGTINGASPASTFSAGESDSNSGGFNGFTASVSITGYIHFWPGDFAGQTVTWIGSGGLAVISGA